MRNQDYQQKPQPQGLDLSHFSSSDSRLSAIREIAGGGSYLSQSDLRAHFGLGKATRAETVEVKWPSGQRQMFHDVDVDKFYLIEEGRDQLGQQRFAKPRVNR